MSTRTERDSLGPVKVPSKKYYGAQTQRSYENFEIGAEKFPREFIRAYGLLKKAAATVNYNFGNLDSNKNIGYQYGVLYENDCLGIDFNYYRDLTKDRDIEESDGFSFTIVLKPFGSTNNYGKNKVFGPEI